MFLFANETVTETANTGFFPPYFAAMLMALVIVFSMVLVLFMIAYRLIDKITPGDLSKELLGREAAQAVPEPHKPNVALAVVVAAMVLGMSIILGLTVHGVLTH